jgi:hypothetical protein
VRACVALLCAGSTPLDLFKLHVDALSTAVMADRRAVLTALAARTATDVDVLTSAEHLRACVADADASVAATVKPAHWQFM